MWIKIVLIILKTIYGLASLKLLLTCIECAIESNKNCRYYREEWGWISLIYALLLIPVGIMIFSSNPFWTWYKIYTIFMLFYPLIIIGTDPYDAFEKAYEAEKHIIRITLIICFIFPILLGIGFKAQKDIYYENAIAKQEFKELKLYSYRTCPNNVGAEHIHIEYYDNNGYLKEMKFWPGKRIDKLSQMDPEDWKQRGQPVIISNENKILYIELDASGIPMGPMVLYVTEDYYKEYIKRIIE